MILRKPYALLIKHFKLLHVILMLCIVYLIYRTELMISFLNEYINTSTIVRGREIVSNLYNVWVFLLPALIILFSSILLVTMTLKKKPRLFYVLCIVGHIGILAVYIYGYSVFGTMEKAIVDLRTIKALRDLLLYCIMFQGVFTVLTLIRGVGFDIKKFDFVSDLQGLEISTTDNEEFELDLDFDISDKKRKGKKAFRYLKYKIKENKFIVRLALGVFVALGIFYVYSNYNIYGKTSPEGTTFTMNSFTLGVYKSYLIETDAQGNLLNGKFDSKGALSSDRYVVVVDVRAKHLGRIDAALNLGSIELDIAGDKYKHTIAYDGKLGDLGVLYKDQPIGNEFSRYLLVYEVPLNTVNSKMMMEFTNTANGKKARIRLNLNKIVNKKTVSERYYLGDTIDFSQSTLGNTTLKISSYELKNRYAIPYKYCSPGKKCIDSYEYLIPNIINAKYDRDKTLLKLEAELKFDEAFVSNEIKDLATLIKATSYIEYTIEGEIRKQNVHVEQIKTKKVNQKNTYYFEVYQEIRMADKIALVFQIRDRAYKYYLK